MLTLNAYKISAIQWNPVDFQTIGDQFDFIKYSFSFDNGMKFNLFPILNNIKDFSFNNKSGIFLTGLCNNSDISKTKEFPGNVNELTSLRSIMTNLDGNIYKHYSVVELLSGLRSSAKEFKIQDELIFNFIDSYVYIEDVFGKVLTNGGYGDGQLTFGPKTEPLNDYQKWEYILNGNIIILFAYNSNYADIVSSNIYKDLELTKINATNLLALSSNTFLVLRSYGGIEKTYDSVVDSFTVKYDSNPLINENDLPVIEKNKNYKQNYLAVFPYEHLNENGKFNFYYHPLKNYQTPEYNYFNDKNNREYYKIYSGTNQNRGTDKIYLNYRSNTLALTFKTNQSTDFYFSPTVDAISIQESGLIESGACGGFLPCISDRIITNKSNIFEEIPEMGVAIKKTDINENRFLCTWLYGNKNTGEKIWYDRYYNPAYYTITEALEKSHLVYNKNMDDSGVLVYDVPSQAILTPGVLYKYYHIGNRDCLDYLNLINYKVDNSENVIYTNILNITSWNSFKLLDNGAYNNNGIAYGNPTSFRENYWKMDGSNYAIFPAEDSLLQEEKLTTSIWLKFDDWKNVNAYQIFGNYYESGFALINDAKTITPLLTIINNGQNKLYNLNFRFSQSSEETVPHFDWDIVQRLSDMSYWVFDSTNAVAIKYDVSGGIVSIKSEGDGEVGEIKLNIVSTISQVETDSKENLYIYDNANKSYIVLDRNGAFIKAGNVVKEANRIEVDFNDNLYDGTNGTPAIYGNCSVIDNNNDLWQIIGPNLYKNKNLLATVGASSQMSCDSYNNIWILSNDDSYTKIDSAGNFVFRYSFSKTPLLTETNCPPAPAPIPPTLKVLDEDLPFLSTNDYKYILTYDDYKQILVTPPKEKLRPLLMPINKRTRVIDFINTPAPNIDETNLTSICGLSSIEYDQVVVVDSNDNQAYILNQLGQLVLKINLENLISAGGSADFKTGGDFTGYQNIRKYKKIKDTTLSWKFQTATKTNDQYTDSNDNTLSFDVSDLSRGWHNFAFTFDSVSGFAKYYIDSVLVATSFFGGGKVLYYKYRSSLVLGATTVKNILLNNYLNLNDGYRMIGSVGDLNMYNIVLSDNDIENLYYTSKVSPTLKELVWNIPVGYRNYVEEITEWFQFQMPTNKSKYFNLNIHNLNVDDEIKNSITLAIKNIIGKLSPAHTVLNKINWK